MKSIFANLILFLVMSFGSIVASGANANSATIGGYKPLPNPGGTGGVSAAAFHEAAWECLDGSGISPSNPVDPGAAGTVQGCSTLEVWYQRASQACANHNGIETLSFHGDCANDISTEPSGIQGQTLEAPPGCPESARACPPIPISTSIQIHKVDSFCPPGGECPQPPALGFEMIQSDSHGNFQVTLPPGSYELVSSERIFASVVVTVYPNRFTQVHIIAR